MLTAVDFLPKAIFEQVAPAEDLVVVSLGDPLEAPPKNLELHGRVLRLEFVDCDESNRERWGYPEEALCTEEQTRALLALITELHASPQAYRLVAHCRAGISRSSAVALIAASLTGCRCPRQAEANYANQHVLALAQRVAGVAVTAPSEPPAGYCWQPLELLI